MFGAKGYGANVYAQMGNLNRAIADFNSALRFEPNSADAYYNRGLARSGLEEPQAAIADYNLAIRLNPNMAEAYGSRGLVRSHQGDKSGAMADLQKAAQLFSAQGNTVAYQQTLNFIQMMQPLPASHSSILPPCPELF